MPHRVVRRRLASACLVAALAGAPLLSATSAHGDPIGDVQSRANEVAAQISQLQGQIEADSNAWEAARYRVSQLQQQISDTQAKVDQAKADEAAKRKQLAAYAINAYVTGGSDTGLPSVLGADATKVDQRQGYAGSAVGDRQQLIDDLQASQKVAGDQVKKLNNDRAAAQQEQDQADAKRASAQRAAAQLQAVQDQLKGQLAELVRQKQEAEARAAQQRAFAQAQAQAQAQAAAAANLPRVPSPPSNGGNRGGGSRGPSGSSNPVIPSNGSAAARAIAAAETQLGVPYVWGGATPGQGFDCSGLTMWAYAQAGIRLSHLTYSQEGEGRVVPLSQIQPGDLVFYWGGGHVALYIGGGSVIHAPHTGDVVRYGSLYMGTPELVVRPGA